jgi:serine protease Do
LMAGDVIVKFDGKEVKESRDLPRLVASMAVGKQVEVVVIRSGKEVTKTVTLGRLEDGEKKVAVATENDDTPKMDAVTKALGMEFSALSDEARKNFKIKDSVKGVIVTSVEPGSAAAERGLRRGDVIEEVNHQAVEHPGDIAKAVEGAKADAKKPALLLVSNGEGEVRFVAVPVD